MCGNYCRACWKREDASAFVRRRIISTLSEVVTEAPNYRPSNVTTPKRKSGLELLHYLSQNPMLVRVILYLRDSRLTGNEIERFVLFFFLSLCLLLFRILSLCLQPYFLIFKVKSFNITHPKVTRSIHNSLFKSVFMALRTLTF